jgi:tetratricopeptide (TPR) repeat protein
MCRGHAYNNKDQHDRAIIDYSQAIKIDRKDADLFLFRGLAHRWKGQYDRAVADFDEAIRLDPSFDAVRAHRAETIALMNKPEFEQTD